ncbi:hypothetical protein M3I54_40470 [Paraburkholderia sp. CNPSo 3274]|nr:hypothetical protein [Paraburkholderia sp. CNPSo 3274]MCP3713087.1 hypothetical protein [Paraburkholderia sp. CNPSo 3274]
MACPACAHFTIDDGRKVDEVLLRQIRNYARGTQALRPAIVRSAKLQDKDCSTQWEMPFDTATSYNVDILVQCQRFTSHRHYSFTSTFFVPSSGMPSWLTASSFIPSLAMLSALIASDSVALFAVVS